MWEENKWISKNVTSGNRCSEKRQDFCMIKKYCSREVEYNYCKASNDVCIEV